MLKFIRILLSIDAHYDYEIWQIDVKTTFLNGNLEEEIYMMQPEGFIAKNQEHMVCKLKKSIYRLKQASRSWNIKFDQVIKSFGFEQNLDEPYVYKRYRDKVVMFLVLYVDNILLIGNDVGSSVKVWLSSQFDMKDLGEANFILGIKLWRDRNNKMLDLSQARYIDKVLERFSMQNSKKGLLPFRHGVPLFDDQRPKTHEEENMMRQVLYASAVGSLMYVMLCIRPYIYYSVGMVSQYQSNPGPKHWQAIKHILKYLRRTRNYMLVYRCENLIPIGYTISNFQLDLDFRKSTSSCVFTLGGGAKSWRSVKQSCTADSTMGTEYVVAYKVANEAAWLKKVLSDLGVVRMEQVLITLFCDNSGAVTQSKDPWNHKKGKHIERKYHIIRDIVGRGDIVVAKIDNAKCLANPFTKVLPQRTFELHLERMGVRLVHNNL